MAAFAEATRLPFDLPEAEQELIGGYHTEYFGIKLMMYLVGEYLHMVTAAFLIVILFGGGWHFWGLTGSGSEVTWAEALLRIVVLNVKVLGMIFFFMLARWAWARFRYDQLMSLAWLVMLPLGMVNFAYVAVWEEYGEHIASRMGLSPNAAMVVCGWAVLLVAWFVATRMARPRERQPTPLGEYVGWTRFGTRSGSASAGPPCQEGIWWACSLASLSTLQRMQTENSKIRWVDPPKLGMLGKSYLMLFIKGLTTALRHLFFHKKITLQSPDERHKIARSGQLPRRTPA